MLNVRTLVVLFLLVVDKLAWLLVAIVQTFLK